MYFVLIVLAAFTLSDIRMPKVFAVYTTQEQCEFARRQLDPALGAEVEKNGAKYSSTCRGVELQAVDKPA